MPSRKDITRITSISPLWDEEKNLIDKTSSYLGDPLERWWRCSNNHSWKETVNKVYRAKNPCPYCDNRKALVGQTDFFTVYPNLFSMVDKSEDLQSIKREHLRSTRLIKLKCSEGHDFQKTIVGLIRSNGSCPACSGAVLVEKINSLKAKYPVIALDWDYEKNKNRLGLESPRKILSKSSKKVFWKCSLCGSEQFKSVANRVKSGCTVCSSENILKKNIKKGVNDFESCYSYLMNRWSENNTVDPSTISKNYNDKILIICPNCEKTLERRANHFVKSPNYCVYCSGKQVETGFNDLSTTHPKIAALYSTRNTVKVETLHYKNNETCYYWSCEKGHIWRATVNSIIEGSSCRYCRSFPSKLEEEVAVHCQKICDEEILYHDKKLIYPLELDILLPDSKMAIEVNGSYFHSNTYLLENRQESAKTYHARKLTLTEQQGITLLFVWESQWRLERVETEELLLKALSERKISPLLRLVEDPFPDWKS